MCDNYFTDVASQSEPNHLFLIAADSPLIDNSSCSRTYQPQPPFHIPSLPQTLAAAGRTWRNYADLNSSYFEHIKALQGNPWNVPPAQFDTDVAKGFLADVSWLYPPYGDSEHPGNQTVHQGAQWTAQRVLAVAKSPLWASTAIIITWDDYGGWYDHVAAPANRIGPAPDQPAITARSFASAREYRVSSSAPTPKTPSITPSIPTSSVVKFCIRLFGLSAWNAPALAKGDPAGDPFEAFDFAAPPRLGVPSVIPN